MSSIFTVLSLLLQNKFIVGLDLLHLMLLCRQTHRDATELLVRHHDPLFNKLRLYVIKKSWKIKPGIGYAPPKNLGCICKKLHTYQYSYHMLSQLIGWKGNNFKQLTEQNPLLMYIWHKSHRNAIVVWGFCPNEIDKTIAMFKRKLDHMLMEHIRHLE